MFPFYYHLKDHIKSLLSELLDQGTFFMELNLRVLAL